VRKIIAGLFLLGVWTALGLLLLTISAVLSGVLWIVVMGGVVTVGTVYGMPLVYKDIATITGLIAIIAMVVTVAMVTIYSQVRLIRRRTLPRTVPSDPQSPEHSLEASQPGKKKAGPNPSTNQRT
jgi:hypothetical protein